MLSHPKPGLTGGLSFYYYYYILLFMLLQLAQFFPPCPPLPSSSPHSLRPFPHHCPCPWVMHIYICSLAPLFPVPYFTSAGLFYNYQFVLLNASSFLPQHPSCLATMGHSLHLSMFCLFVYFGFLQSIVDRYVFIAILLFTFFHLLLLKEDPVIFHIILVWW